MFPAFSDTSMILNPPVFLESLVRLVPLWGLHTSIVLPIPVASVRDGNFEQVEQGIPLAEDERLFCGPISRSSCIGVCIFVLDTK